MARTTATVRLPPGPGQPRPLTGGIVRDRPPWELRANEAVTLTDVVWPNGVPVERGPWTLTATPAALTSVNSAAAVYNDETATTTFEAHTGVGVQQLGATRTGAGNGGVYLHRATYGGERIFVDVTGYGNAIRFAGASGVTGSLTGTIAVTQGSNVITGTGTSFLTQVAVGQYLGIPGEPLTCRVIKVESDTRLSVAKSVEVATASGISTAAYNSGMVGLLTPIVNFGTVSCGGTSTLTGKGSLWKTAPYTLQQYDQFGQIGNANVYEVSSVTNDTSLFFSGSSFPSWTDVANYQVGRPGGAGEVCVHRGRLFFAAIPSARNRLCATPPGYNLGSLKNQQDSFETNRIAAQTMDYADIPAPGAEGRTVALLSGGDPGPLLILRSTDVYRGDGDGGASDLTYTRVDGLGAEAGCADIRSAVRGADGLFWAGPEGVYRWTGGNVVDLTDGRIKREWQALMRSRTSSARIFCLNVDQHLIVWFEDLAQTSACYACHLPTGGWTQFSNLRARCAFLYRKPGARDVGYFVPNAYPTQVASLDGVLRDDPARAAPQVTDPDVPAFQATTAATLTGDEQDVERVLEASISYELVGAGNAGLLVESAADGAAFGTDGTLPAGNAGQLLVQTPKAQPDVAEGGGIGRLGQQFAMRFTRTGNPASRLRLHEIRLTLRKRRPRARPR